MVSTKKQKYPHPSDVTYASLYVLVEVKFYLSTTKPYIHKDHLLVEIPCMDYKFSPEKYKVTENIRRIRARQSAKEYVNIPGHEFLSASIIQEFRR